MRKRRGRGKLLDNEKKYWKIQSRFKLLSFSHTNISNRLYFWDKLSKIPNTNNLTVSQRSNSRWLWDFITAYCIKNAYCILNALKFFNLNFFMLNYFEICLSSPFLARISSKNFIFFTNFVHVFIFKIKIKI